MALKMDHGNTDETNSELTMTNLTRAKKRVSFSSTKSILTFDAFQEYGSNADRSPIECEAHKIHADKINENYIDFQLNRTVVMEEDMDRSIDPEKWMHSFDENTNSIVTSFQPASSQRDLDTHDETHFFQDTISTDDSNTSEYSVALTFSDEKSKFSAERILSALDVTTMAQIEDKHENSTLFPSGLAKKILSDLNNSDENGNLFSKKSTTFADLCIVSPFKTNTKCFPFSTSVRENQSIQSDCDSKMADESFLENEAIINTEDPSKELFKTKMSDSYDFSYEQTQSREKKESDINSANCSFIKTFDFLTTSDKFSAASNKKSFVNEDKDVILDSLSVVVHKLDISPSPTNTFRCKKIDVGVPHLENVIIPKLNQSKCNDKINTGDTTPKINISPRIKSTENKNNIMTTRKSAIQPQLKNAEYDNELNIGVTTHKSIVSPVLRTKNNDIINMAKKSPENVISTGLNINDELQSGMTTSEKITSPFQKNLLYNDKINRDLTILESLHNKNSTEADFKISSVNNNELNSSIINEGGTKKLPLLSNIPSIEYDLSEKVTNTVSNKHSAKITSPFLANENKTHDVSLNKTYCKSKNEKSSEKKRKKDRRRTYTITKVNENFGETILQENYSNDWLEDNSTTFPKNKPLANSSLILSCENVLLPIEKDIKDNKNLVSNFVGPVNTTFNVNTVQKSVDISLDNVPSPVFQEICKTPPKIISNLFQSTPSQSYIIPSSVLRVKSSSKKRRKSLSGTLSETHSSPLPCNSKSNISKNKVDSLKISGEYSNYSKQAASITKNHNSEFLNHQSTPNKNDSLGSNDSVSLADKVIITDDLTKSTVSLSGMQENILKRVDTVSPQCSKVLEKTFIKTNCFQNTLSENNFVSDPVVVESPLSMKLRSSSKTSHDDSQYFRKSTNIVPSSNSSLLQYNQRKNSTVAEEFINKSKTQRNSSKTLDSDDCQFLNMTRKELSQGFSKEPININSSFKQNCTATEEFITKSKTQRSSSKTLDSDDCQFLNMTRQELSQGFSKEPININSSYLLCTPTENHTVPMLKSVSSKKKKESNKSKLISSNPLQQSCTISRQISPVFNFQSSFDESKNLQVTNDELSSYDFTVPLIENSIKNLVRSKSKYRSATPIPRRISTRIANKSLPSSEKVSFSEMPNLSVHTATEKFEMTINNKQSKNSINKQIEKTINKQKKETYKNDFKNEKKIPSPEVKKLFEEKNKTESQKVQSSLVDDSCHSSFHLKPGLVNDNSYYLIKTKDTENLVTEESSDIFKSKDKILRSPKTNSTREENETSLEKKVCGSSRSEYQQSETIILNEVEAMVHTCKCEKWDITILEKHSLSITFSNYTYHKLHIQVTGNEIKDWSLVQLKLNKELPPEKFVLDLMENVVSHSLKSEKTFDQLPELLDDVYKRLALWLPVAKDIYSVFYKFLGCVKLKNNGISINYVVEKNVKCAFYLNVSFDYTKYEPNLQYSLEHMVLHNILDHVQMFINSKRSQLKTIMDVSKLVHEFVKKVSMGQITFGKDPPYAQGGIVYHII